MASHRANRVTHQAGFTLVELMIVVAIVGILSVVAMPMFASYMGKARSTEGVGFLAEVKSRQESYRFDFGMYMDVSGNRGTYYPGGDPGRSAQPWIPATMGNWNALGAMPSGGESRFVYSTVGGGPGVDPGGRGFTNHGYTAAPTDFWFITTAVGDLNENCTGTTDQPCNMILESYSHAKSIYSSTGDGWE